MKLGGAKLFVVGMLASLVLGWLVFPRLFYASKPQPVEFNHVLHTSDKVGLGCQDCHGFAENGAFVGIPKLEQCVTCHAEATGTTDEEHRFVEEYVKQNREVPWRVYARQPDNVYFSHFYHVKAETIECKRCHGEQGATTTLRPLLVNVISGYSRDIEGNWISGSLWKPPAGLKMSDCIDCHEEHGCRSACIDCHK
jgi:hypothetical protein